MVTSLGHDAISSCAAARAGISRARELGIMKVRREEDGEMEEVVGHSVPVLTDGFEGDGRLIALGWTALKDLLKPAVRTAIDWNRTALFMALPNFNRTRLGANLIQDEDLRKAKESEQTESSDPREDLAHAQRLIDRILKLVDAPLSPDRRFVNFGEHAAFPEAIRGAMETLAKGGIDQVIVGAIDSLIDSKVLSWLYQTGRLKCSDMPAGLQPGEASAFLLLERTGSKKLKGRGPLGRIAGIAEAIEPSPLLQGKPATGQALAQILGRLAATQGSAEKTFIVSDQNGEPYRAYDWGLAQNRLAAKFPWIGEVPILYPAINFGDTGAASVAVATGTVLRAWQRWYVKYSTAWIMGVSVEGAYSAMGINQPTETRF